jgi:hypothetical protein
MNPFSCDMTEEFLQGPAERVDICEHNRHLACRCRQWFNEHRPEYLQDCGGVVYVSISRHKRFTGAEDGLMSMAKTGNLQGVAISI